MTKKMLIISQHFYPEIGSAGNRMKNIYELLKDKGYELKLITTDPSYPSRKLYLEDSIFWDNEALNREERETDHIIRIKVSHRKYSRNMFNRLFHYLEVVFKVLLYVIRHPGKYDSVYVTSPQFFMAFAGLFAKYRYRTKLILEIRDLWPESLNGVGVFNHPLIMFILKRLERHLYHKADRIIVNSKGFIHYMKEQCGISTEKISCIPNGIRTDELASEKTKEDTAFKVIYAGNMGLAQDTDLLIKLAKKLETYKIELTIIGYGVRRKDMIEEVKKLNLKNVSFMKPQTRKQCFDLIASHDVGVMTLSNKEVFKTVLPGKLIDYMACGTPIVAMASGFSKSLIEESKVGYCYETYQADDILNSILSIYQNADSKRELGSNGLKVIKKHFLWESHIHQLVEVVESL